MASPSVRAAIDAFHEGAPYASNDQPAQIGSDVTDHIIAISEALSRHNLVDNIRRRAITRESVSHV